MAMVFGAEESDQVLRARDLSLSNCVSRVCRVFVFLEVCSLLKRDSTYEQPLTYLQKKIKVPDLNAAAAALKGTCCGASGE